MQNVDSLAIRVTRILRALALVAVAAAALIGFSTSPAYSYSFKISAVSWVGDTLRIELQTNAADGTELNVAISDEKTGNHIVSVSVKSVQVASGKVVAEGF